MSYNSSTGIITAPVSINDVRQALGASSYDLGTLCTMSNINKWSLKKPHFTNDLSTKKILHIDYDNDTVYFIDGTTGILAEYMQSPINGDSYSYCFGMRMISQLDVINNLSNTTDPILNSNGVIDRTRYYQAYQSTLGAYTYPIDNANYRNKLHGYRLTDFNGYNHKAKADSLLGCRFEVNGFWQPAPNVTQNLTIGDMSYTADEIKNFDNNLKRGTWMVDQGLFTAPKALLDQGYIKIRIETKAEKDSNSYYPLDYVLNKMFGWSASGSQLTYLYLAVEIRNTSSNSTQGQINSIYSYANSGNDPVPLYGGFINNNKTPNRTKTIGATTYQLWDGNSRTYCIPIGRYNASNKKFDFGNSTTGANVYAHTTANGDIDYIEVSFYAQKNSVALYKFPPFATSSEQYREFFEIAINIGWCATNSTPSIINSNTHFPSYGLRKVIRFGN